MLNWTQIVKVLYFFGFCFSMGFVYLVFSQLVEQHRKDKEKEDEI